VKRLGPKPLLIIEYDQLYPDRGVDSGNNKREGNNAAVLQKGSIERSSESAETLFVTIQITVPGSVRSLVLVALFFF
jgi:hypothetical protein